MKAKLSRIEGGILYAKEINETTNAKMGKRHENFESMLKELPLHSGYSLRLIPTYKSRIFLDRDVEVEIGHVINVEEVDGTFKIIQ